MYRLFRTTTKIQYPIYMQFLSFNDHRFIVGGSLLEFRRLSDCSNVQKVPEMASDPFLGVGGGGRVRGGGGQWVEINTEGRMSRKQNRNFAIL